MVADGGQGFRGVHSKIDGGSKAFATRSGLLNLDGKTCGKPLDDIWREVVKWFTGHVGDDLDSLRERGANGTQNWDDANGGVFLSERGVCCH